MVNLIEYLLFFRLNRDKVIMNRSVANMNLCTYDNFSPRAQEYKYPVMFKWTPLHRRFPADFFFQRIDSGKNYFRISKKFGEYEKDFHGYKHEESTSAVIFIDILIRTL